MRYISRVAAAILLALAGSGSAETNEEESIGLFLVSLPVRNLDSVIDFCGEKIPELKDDLLGVRTGFFGRLADAGKLVIETHKDDPEFNAPLEDSLREEITNSHVQGLTLLKQQDPRVICPNVLENMKHGTVDELRGVLEETFDKFSPARNVVGSKE